MGREFELKYRATPEKIAAIQEKFGGFAAIRMLTAYYDTPDGALSRRRWMLRRRMENGRSVCTVKTPLRDGSRGEWEVESGDIGAAIGQLCRLGAPGELLSLTEGGIAEVCAARFTRLAAKVESAGCDLELALDQGSLLGGGKELPFAEVEVELKNGSEIMAVAFAEKLAKEFDLTAEPASKAKRALALAQK